jgi:hypothetical protein
VVFVSGQRGSQAILCYNLSKVDATPPPPLTGRKRSRRRLDVWERLQNYPYLALYVYQLKEAGRPAGGRLAGWMRPERLEKGGPCWLLKLRQMGTQREQIKRVLPWLVRLIVACRYKSFLFCLGCSIVGPEQNILFPHRTLFQFLCPHRPASWAGSRAGSLVSWYVSLCLSSRASLLCVLFN